EPGSAADQAGIRSGDVIMAVDAQPVADFEALTSRLSGRDPGEVLRVEILRDRADGTAERLTCDVRLDAW
ncbi:MAG: PDZ domain-containing protein, partial [Planctomycetia bacterium]|nr:PDZ domain-containing protein [Planctomycetia bacterium]